MMGSILAEQSQNLQLFQGSARDDRHGIERLPKGGRREPVSASDLDQERFPADDTSTVGFGDIHVVSMQRHGAI
jgi:hypothetical protein